MKLRNKKTGEIVEAIDFNIISDYDSLAELNEEWEDYEEEPKEYYLVDVCGEVEATDRGPDDELAEQMQSIGNYFETKEEAEKAVEKLKAWKRLKDKGFKITFVLDGGYVYLQADWGLLLGDFSDVELLFGGEE